MNIRSYFNSKTKKKAFVSGTEAEGPRVLALIDYQDHARGGHFGPYLVWFTREFAARFEAVLVFTPDPQRTAALLRLSEAGAKKNVFCHPLPPGPRKRFYRLKRKPCPLVKIFRKAANLCPGQRLQGFIMWSYDLLLAEVAQGKSGVPWATLFPMSFTQRRPGGRGAETEFRLKGLCENHPDCVSFLLLDQYIISSGGTKAQWCPGYENVDFSSGVPIADTIRRHSNGRFCIGGVGQLTGYRCLHELLRLAPLHPEMSFVLVGKIDEGSVREDLRPLLGANKPANLLIIPGFQENEEINAAVEACDAILIDGGHYPVHSGIATKALSFGKFLLTPKSNSWTHDMIREYGVGLAYTDPEMDFTQAWNLWRQGGGPGRSKKAVEGLTNPARVADCFNLLCQRLDRAEIRQ